MIFTKKQAKALSGKRVQLRNDKRHVITGMREEHDDCFEMRGGVHDSVCIARKREDDSSPADIVKILRDLA